MKIAQGETQQYKATAIYNSLPQYKPDVTNDPNTTWTAGNTGVAELNAASKGYAKGIAPGKSYIWCDYKGVQSTTAAMLEVGPPRAIMIITPDPAYLRTWGNRVSFTATATYSDSAIPPMDMTNGVTWSCNTYGIVKSWTLPNMFELQTYNNGTTTVSATSIVADRYSGKFLTASATLIYGDANKNPCGLTYVPYDQHDPKWAVPYDNYPPFTIADKGCLLTCYAMIFATKGLKINGQLVDPINLNQWLIDKGGYDIGNIDANIIKLFPNAPSSLPFDTINLSDLDAALTNCRPAIVKVSSCRTGYDHFVVVLRKNGNDYDIIDPYKFAETKLSAYTVNNTYGDKNIHQIISF